MRDPARIPLLLAKLQAYWTARPDLRLGQVMVALTPPGQELFIVEDDVLDARLPEVPVDLAAVRAKAEKAVDLAAVFIDRVTLQDPSVLDDLGLAFMDLPDDYLDRRQVQSTAGLLSAVDAKMMGLLREWRAPTPVDGGGL